MIARPTSSAKGDICTLEKRGHFYFGLTVIFWHKFHTVRDTGTFNKTPYAASEEPWEMRLKPFFQNAYEGALSKYSQLFESSIKETVPVVMVPRLQIRPLRLGEKIPDSVFQELDKLRILSRDNKPDNFGILIENNKEYVVICDAKFAGKQISKVSNGNRKNSYRTVKNIVILSKNRCLDKYKNQYLEKKNRVWSPFF